MREVTLTVSVEEANVILEGLGQMPFARVYALVAKLQEQAADQLNGGDETPRAVLKEAGAVEGKAGA